MIAAFIGLTSFFIDLLIRQFSPFGVWNPDILLIAVMYIGLTRPLGEAYVLAFCVGLLWDTVYLDIPGMHSFLFILATMIIGKMRRVFWAQYAVSRLLMGFSLSCLVRFGEVMFWLSNLDGKIPVVLSKHYILYGPLITGLCFFFFFPTRSKPLEISQRSPKTIFTEW
ncbi:MAG: rod shape-determining protein MreD [bacterium]|jgi:rod shape-determining protein MreD|nr:rod shape-determining protein MreD [bacterium]